MIFHENRLPADDSHENHALFVIFDKAAKFEIVVCCKFFGGVLRVKYPQQLCGRKQQFFAFYIQSVRAFDFSWIKMCVT